MIRLRILSPYVRALEQWAKLGLHILRLGEKMGKNGPIVVDARKWERRLASLGDELPPREVMALHSALMRQGLPWQWLGGEVTKVGQGSRARLVQGVPDDPQKLAEHLGRLDIRIPVYTITGSIGKTTTTRLLSQILEHSGLRLGIQASDGAWIAGVKIADGDQISGHRARYLTRQEDVDAAVLELGRGGLIDGGFAFDRVDLAVLLNVQAVHVGLDGVETVEKMADVKAITIRRAAVAVLNLEDSECRRIGSTAVPNGVVWFAVGREPNELSKLSLTCRGALGVVRDPAGAPQTLRIWCDGAVAADLSLEGVAPYHGMLGEKTLEELLAVIAAAWFGPIQVERLEELLPRLRLDRDNHLFRTSLHRKGNLLFVLDKADYVSSLQTLKPAIESLCRELGVTRRIAIFARSAAYRPEAVGQICGALYSFMDEFVCFDRAEGYTSHRALPCWSPGSIAPFIKEQIEGLNRDSRQRKPMRAFDDWDQVEAYLRLALADPDDMTLVLINQPTTVATELNQRIVAFVNEMTLEP